MECGGVDACLVKLLELPRTANTQTACRILVCGMHPEKHDRCRHKVPKTEASTIAGTHDSMQAIDSEHEDDEVSRNTVS